MKMQEQYQAELERSDREHHQPTAGAMIGHVTANLVVHSLKIEQARLFAKGTPTLFLATYASPWIDQEVEFIQRINDALAVEGDLIPTTTKEFIEFSMLEEDGSLKYAEGNEQLFSLIKDFDTQLLFITRAIKLAEKEEHYGQVRLMEELDEWIKEQITMGQKFLGHELKEGLYVEEDEEAEE